MVDVNTRLAISAASQSGVAPSDASVADLLAGSKTAAAQTLLGAGLVIGIRVALSNAQLLALSSNPVMIIPAPGAGKCLVILADCYIATPGTMPFTYPDGGQNGLYFGPTAADVPADQSDQGVFAQAAAAIAYNACSLQADLASVENLPVFLTSRDGDMTDGDGTGSVTAFYAIIDV